MDCIIEYIERNFSEKRRIHTYAVRDLAISLAEHYGADAKKAEIAALFHDFYRGVSEAALNAYVRQMELPKRYLDNCNLAHGKIAAIIMKRDYGIEDEDIINAVSYHTTGRTGMSKLEKIIYLADAIEPNRQYPGVDDIRKLAYVDLNEACLLSVNHSIDFIREKGVFLDEDTLEAQAFLINEIKKEKEKLNE